MLQNKKNFKSNTKIIAVYNFYKKVIGDLAKQTYNIQYN